MFATCSTRYSYDFNPRPSYEERRAEPFAPKTSAVFQSTPLIRGATSSQPHDTISPLNFNPRPSYEERRHVACHIMDNGAISIHAPHTRSDDLPVSVKAFVHHFNPRPSYEERHGRGEAD